jgi:adenylate cyclase
MRLTSDTTKTWLAAGAGAVLAATVGWFLHTFPIGHSLRYASYDILHVWRGDIQPADTVLVYMDEVSHEELQQPYNTAWDRRIHAKLVDRLMAAGAKAIVFDVVFSDPSDPAADNEFARAIKQSGRVILAADNVPVGEKAKKMTPPLDLLRDAAADMGSAETIPDSDFTIRRHTPEDTLPALSWVAAAFLKTKATEEADPGGKWLLYYGPPDHFTWRSYHEALDRTKTEDNFFRDKTVFVGVRLMTKFSGQRKDEYRNPYSSFLARASGRGNQRPFISGVEVQATAFLNLMRGEWLTRAGLGWERAALVLIGFAAGFGLVLLRPTWAAFAALAGTVLISVVAYLVFRRGLTWFPWLIATIQVGVALSWSVLFNSIQLYVQKKLYEQQLSRYLPPKLVKKFLKEPDLLRRPAQKRTVTLLFSDIAGFTTLAEGMDSDELSKMMNRYFETAVSEGIHKCDGTIVKYIGDAVFAFWNAPDDQADHQVRACQAALCFRDMSLRWVDDRPIRTRIGIHTGVANVGDFGSRERVDYTALGENVNLAARVEGLNKYLGTTYLATRATQDGIGAAIVTREVGLFRLKGFERAVQIFELVGLPEEAAATLPWREAFAEGLTYFKKHNLAEAEAAFKRTLALRPEDGPSKYYIGVIAEFKDDPAPEQWTGEIELKEK